MSEHTRKNALKGHSITFYLDDPETFLSTPNLDIKRLSVMTFVGSQRQFDDQRGRVLCGEGNIRAILHVNSLNIYQWFWVLKKSGKPLV